MTIISTEVYRSALSQYLRNGTPLRLSLKDAGRMGRYVWRTARDEKVRLSHRQNDGRIFDWADAPDTGHPGEEFNCRCVAVPYVDGQTEYASHDLSTTLAAGENTWSDWDFIVHFYTGRGREVTLDEIGHLFRIVQEYGYRDGLEGALRRISDQIAKEAREGERGYFSYPFSGTYQFESVTYSHGRSTVTGAVTGHAVENNGMLNIRATVDFNFYDRFTDPFEIRDLLAALRESPDRIRRLAQRIGAVMGIADSPTDQQLQIDPNEVSDIFLAISDVGGSAFDIIGGWRSLFEASVKVDARRSEYG